MGLERQPVLKRIDTLPSLVEGASQTIKTSPDLPAVYRIGLIPSSRAELLIRSVKLKIESKDALDLLDKPQKFHPSNGTEKRYRRRRGSRPRCSHNESFNCGRRSCPGGKNSLKSKRS